MTLYIGDKPVGLYRVVKDTKYIDKTKFGVSIDDVVGTLDENGTYSYVRNTSANPVVFDFSSVKKISEDGMFYFCMGFSFYYYLDFSSLETVEDSGLRACCKTETLFPNSFALTGANFSSLKTIGYSGMRDFAQNQYGLKYAGLYLLETIESYGLYAAFAYTYCEGFNLDSLKYVAANGLNATFSGIRSYLKGEFYFPSLVSANASAFQSTTASSACFYNDTAITGLHFRADSQALIESLKGYSNKFGATNATIYFDLIGTITVNGVAYSRNEPNSIRVDNTKTYVAWANESGNVVYTDATAEPAVGTAVYSDAGTTQVGTVSEAA
jgi:hypothetical protein